MHVPHFSFRRLSFLILILCSVTLFINGCGAPATPTPSATPESSAASTTSTLVLWHTFGDDRAQALDDLTTEFHKIYPDLAIQSVYVGGHDDLTKQMTAALALGNPPDIVLADRRQIAEFAAQGGLEPLDTWMSDSELGLSKQDRADYYRGALTLGKFPTLDNLTYGFPFTSEPLVLFYNADLLKTANLNRPPNSWEQFTTDAAAVTQDNTYAWAMDANTATFEAILASRGSALLTNAEDHALFQERAGLATLQLIADLNEGGLAVLATSEDKAQRAFGSGDVAFYMGWLSEIGALQQAQKDNKHTFDIGVGPMPQLDPTSPWLLTRGDLFGISKTTKEREHNAWFFIRWITAPTQSARWSQTTDSLPLRASALTFLDPKAGSAARYRQILDGLNGADPQFLPQPAHPFIDSIEETVGELWLQATQPKADLRAALDGMATRVNQLLAIQP